MASKIQYYKKKIKNFLNIKKVLKKALKYHTFLIKDNNTVNKKVFFSYILKKAIEYKNNIDFSLDIIRYIKINSIFELYQIITILSDFWFFLPRKEYNNKSIIEVYKSNFIKPILLPNYHQIIDFLIFNYSIIKNENFLIKPIIIAINNYKKNIESLLDVYKDNFNLKKIKKDNIYIILNTITFNLKEEYKDKLKILKALHLLIRYITINKINLFKTNKKEIINKISIYSASLEYIIKNNFNIDNYDNNLIKNLCKKYKIKKNKINTLKNIIKDISNININLP